VAEVTKPKAAPADPAAELDELRSTMKAITHSIVPRDLVGEPGDRTGWCFLCGRFVWETGDWRGGRFRHEIE
jgi:hypothetical protein